ARPALQIERRRAAGRPELGVVPKHDVPVFELDLVRADGRRRPVALEHPARLAGGREAADLVDVRTEAALREVEVELAREARVVERLEGVGGIDRTGRRGEQRLGLA